MTGPELRRQREATGKTPTEFAAILGVSERSLYRYETGDSPITAMVERAILSVLDELAVPLGQVGTKTPPPGHTAVRRKDKRSK